MHSKQQICAQYTYVEAFTHLHIDQLEINPIHGRFFKYAQFHVNFMDTV